MIKKRRLGRGVAMVGAGMSPFGMFREWDSRDLFVDAFRAMIESVDTGRGYILAGTLIRPQVDTICRRLLANDVIERYACYEGGQ